MRSEQTLGSYSFENVAFHLLRKRRVLERVEGVVTDVDRGQDPSLYAIGADGVV